MIIGSQIRAARALINMSQDELAQATGLTPQAIRKIESSSVTPREGTISDITKVFHEHNVEFFKNRGVAIKDDEIVTYTGDKAFIKLLDTIVSSQKDAQNPEALFACVTDSVSPPLVIENYRRLREHGIKMRSLIREGDTHLMGRKEEYRYIPKKFFHNNATVIFGNKFATMLLNPQTREDEGIIIIKNSHIATAQRNLFNFIWSVGNNPTKTTAKVFYDE